MCVFSAQKCLLLSVLYVKMSCRLDQGEEVDFIGD